MSFYVYGSNNPVNFNDPSGLTNLLQYLERGIRVINKTLDVHPNTGVAFKEGFPDFSQQAVKEVKLNNLSGTDKDFGLANKAAGYESTPKGYTWHHVQDGTTMQLVPTSIHQQTAHTGGSAWLKSGGAAAAAGVAGNAEASSGVSWSNVKDFASGVRDFAVDVLTDPSTYYTPLMLLARRETGGCSNGVCSDMINWNKVGPTSSYNPAGGGFLLYPNKANTNMMQSVYSK
jgi:hypothetical protein